MALPWTSWLEKAAAKRRQKRSDRIAELPDRKLLIEAYLPTAAAWGGRILFVGAQMYTAHYPAILESQGGEAWTMDIDPDAAVWGHPERHRTGDICHLDQVFPGMMFDTILCNGVLGYGVNSIEQQRQALTSMAGALKPEGVLLLGWNTDKIEDPVAAGLTAGHFAPQPFAGQPARVTWPGMTHTYDSFTRLP